tara:strand:+ start:194 stop:724 length:531 start_codon:yes stop_codon:yes gene_type:complete
MSENLEPKELPHQLLMRRYSIEPNALPPHANQLKKDLDKTLQLIINKSKGGAIKLTPNTQQKIEAYDRYICDGIFEFLETKEVISEKLVEEIKESAEEKREEFVEKMEEIHEEAVAGVVAETENKNTITENTVKESTQQNEPPITSKDAKNIIEKEEPIENSKEEQGVKIGFWDWK